MSTSLRDTGSHSGSGGRPGPTGSTPNTNTSFRGGVGRSAFSVAMGRLTQGLCDMDSTTKCRTVSALSKVYEDLQSTKQMPRSTGTFPHRATGNTGPSSVTSTQQLQPAAKRARTPVWESDPRISSTPAAIIARNLTNKERNGPEARTILACLASAVAALLRSEHGRPENRLEDLNLVVSHLQIGNNEDLDALKVLFPKLKPSDKVTRVEILTDDSPAAPDLGVTGVVVQPQPRNAALTLTQQLIMDYGVTPPVGDSDASSNQPAKKPRT
jgi:hypothetical protein